MTDDPETTLTAMDFLVVSAGIGIMWFFLLAGLALIKWAEKKGEG